MSDITTRDQALKALHDLTTEQKRLAERGDAMEQQLAQKTADLKEIQRVMAESHAPQVVVVSEKEATLRRYVNTDGTIDMGKMCMDPTDRGEWHADFKRLVDDRNFCRMLTKNGKGSPKLDAKLRDHMEKAPSVIHRVFSDASGVGEDFVPDTFLPELGRKLYQPTALEAALPSMNVSGKEIRIPFSSAAVAPYLKSGATWSSITASDSTTDQISATVKSLAARITADEDTAADSLIDAMSYFRDELATALSHAVEDACINGDNATTHADINTVASVTLWSGGGRWDTGAVASTAADHRRSWIGFRAASFD